MPVRATPGSKAPVERCGRCVSAHENGVQWAHLALVSSGGSPAPGKRPLESSPALRLLGISRQSQGLREEAADVPAVGASPREPTGGGSLWSVWGPRCLFPARAAVTATPLSQTGHRPCHFLLGCWGPWASSFRAAGAAGSVLSGPLRCVGGSLLCSPPLSAQARFPDGGGPPVNADDPVSAPIPAGGPLHHGRHHQCGQQT